MEKRSGQKLGNKTLPKSSQAKMRGHVLAMDESAEVMRQEIFAEAETRLNLIPFARSTNTEQL